MPCGLDEEQLLVSKERSADGRTRVKSAARAALTGTRLRDRAAGARRYMRVEEREEPRGRVPGSMDAEEPAECLLGHGGVQQVQEPGTVGLDGLRTCGLRGGHPPVSFPRKNNSDSDDRRQA